MNDDDRCALARLQEGLAHCRYFVLTGKDQAQVLSVLFFLKGVCAALVESKDEKAGAIRRILKELADKHSELTYVYDKFVAGTIPRGWK